MRPVLLSAQLCVLLAAVVLQFPDSLALEICPTENCLPPTQCDAPWDSGVCNDKKTICCSVVKSEFRTLCRHHGGECMKTCNEDLQRNTTDCPDDRVCCVLV